MEMDPERVKICFLKLIRDRKATIFEKVSSVAAKRAKEIAWKQIFEALTRMGSPLVRTHDVTYLSTVTWNDIRRNTLVSIASTISRTKYM